MIQTKQLYLSPTTETLVVQVEEMICGSGDFNPNNWNPGNDDWFNPGA